MTSPAASQRSILSISGEDRISFLQGILTQDVSKLNEDKIQFTAMLSPQGKILHDMFLVAGDNAVLIDVLADHKETFLKRLEMYKLRAKVRIEDASGRWCVTNAEDSGTAMENALPDPRHARLPHRLYREEADAASYVPFAPWALGIPELGRDFAPDCVVALDAGYDLLHAVSFTKGCYVGQEVTARMHYKNIARRGFFILQNDTLPTRLTLLKFEEVDAGQGKAVVDGETYHATLPEWLAGKYAQFRTAQENQ